MPKKGRRATRTTPGFTGPFKGQPQPGTLFDVRTVPKTGEEVGPRGYSLNRSRQFQDVIQERPGYAMKAGQVGLGVKYREKAEGEPTRQGQSEERGTTPAVEPEQHPFGPAHLGEVHNREVGIGEFERKEGQHPGYFSGSQEFAKSMQRGRSKMIDVLSRSTIDPEHLKGLSHVSIQPKHPEYAGTYLGGESRRMHLHVTEASPEDWSGEGPFHPDWVKQPKQRGPVDPHSEITLLHELGHHVSETAGRAQYRTPMQQGREEAFADSYAMTHYRHDPRTARWAGRLDPREHTYQARGLEHAHFAAGGFGGEEEYREELGPHNVQPPSTSLGHTLKESGEREAWERPMLDMPEVRVGRDPIFTDVPKGFKDRAGIYEQRAVRTNIARRRVRESEGEIKRRWGVDRNRNLGQQWE